jgi:hypothetical protein
MHGVSWRRRWRKISICCRSPALVSSTRKFPLSFLTMNPAPIVWRWRWSTSTHMVRRSHSQAPMAAISTSRICVRRSGGPSIRGFSLLFLKRILPRKAIQCHCLPGFNVFPSQAMISRQNSFFNFVGVFLLGPLSKTCSFCFISVSLEVNIYLYVCENGSPAGKQ